MLSRFSQATTGFRGDVRAAFQRCGETVATRGARDPALASDTLVTPRSRPASVSSHSVIPPLPRASEVKQGRGCFASCKPWNATRQIPRCGAPACNHFFATSPSEEYAKANSARG